jgi:poly-gamma-glutamate system protein
MYRPSIKSKRTLIFLMLLSAALFYWSENSRVQVRQPNYDLKIQAARKMQQALEALRRNREDAGWALDEVNDPNQSALVGLQYSLITTDQGDLGAKLTTINPNFAAVVLQMLIDAGVLKGDHVAVAFTGSFPALNIAVIIACETLEAVPVIITSVGSSMWGANEPEFTYLDMEKILFDQGIIHHRTIAASIGGGEDIGRSLSQAGRSLIEEAMQRNDVPLIAGKSLEENIHQRRVIYNERSEGKPYKVFINVGGGAAVLGTNEVGNMIPPGLNRVYRPMNYPAKGLLVQMWEEGTPVIHLLNVDRIAESYGLPRSPVPLPPVGSGKIFEVEKYNLKIAGFSAALLFAVLFAIVLLDRDKYKLREEGVDPDTLI